MLKDKLTFSSNEIYYQKNGMFQKIFFYTLNRDILISPKIYTCIYVLQRRHNRDFPGDLVIKILHFHCRGYGFHPRATCSILPHPHPQIKECTMDVILEMVDYVKERETC